MLKQRMISVLLVLTSAFTLLNGNAFGSKSLISFFFYALTISAATVLLFGRLLIKKPAIAFPIPNYIKVFAILVVYVFVHGIINNNIGITHYYWAANLLTLVCAHYWFATRSTPIAAKPAPASIAAITFLKGIAIVVLLESLVVLLQCAYIIPVPSPFFWCTGTWINPNVTAMFLALGLFAVIKMHKQATKPSSKIMALTILIISLLAIAALQCRSAYLAALVIAGAAYGSNIQRYIKSRLKLNLTGISLILLLAIAVLGFASVFVTKKVSAYNRVQIWQTSGELIQQKPVTGHGFGLFEKEYNLFAASKQYEQNDHINMPYNDFIELGVEGGLVAVILWIAFGVLAWRHFAKKGRFAEGLLPVLLAFLLIQLTNFGFQAIPAHVLFLMYIGGGNNLLGSPVQAPQMDKATGYAIPAYASIGFTVVVLVAMALFYQVANLMGLFYNKWMISKAPIAQQTIKSYRSLQSGLQGYASFHESVGDVLLYQKQPAEAKQQYLQALERTSETDVLAKCGYCYQLLGSYDSSAYYYQLTQYMQPHMFTPNLRLLKLYEQQKDSAMIAGQALYIINKPIKVRNKRVFEIKKYAALKLDSCRKTNIYNQLLQEKAAGKLYNEN